MPNCPKCLKPMKELVYPDVTLDGCGTCGGTFFDKGELDKVITAKSYTIECVPDHIGATDYLCPRCQTKMDLVTLSLVDRVEIERCPACNGLFLDSREDQLVNAKLRESNRSKLDERYRRFRDERLVTIRKEIEAFPVSTAKGGTSAKSGERVFVTVYYKKELGINLVAKKINGFQRLKRIFGLPIGVTLSQISEVLQRNYIIQSSDELQVQKIFTYDVQCRLEKLISGELKIYTKAGDITFYDNGIVYSEGLYSEKTIVNLVAKAKEVTEELLKIAKQVDRKSL